MSVVPDRLARMTRGGIAPIARRLHALGVTDDNAKLAFKHDLPGV